MTCGCLLGAKDGALGLSSGAGSISGSISGGLFLVVYFWVLFLGSISGAAGQIWMAERSRLRKGGAMTGTVRGDRAVGLEKVLERRARIGYVSRREAWHAAGGMLSGDVEPSFLACRMCALVLGVLSR